MPELLVVRHGQARFGAADAGSYDSLSELGHRQAAALGDTLRGLGWVPDRVVTGTLTRHHQTYAEMGFSLDPEEHAGFNEYDFHDLLTARFSGSLPTDVEQDRKAHFRALRSTLREWQQDQVPGVAETWTQFTARVDAARQHATRQGAERVLVVSSGGVIGQLVASALGTSPEQMIALNLQVKNTSLTRFIFTERAFFLHEFNATPHFADADRAELMSFS
jgi:broad specificity phosphatase PhoE